MRLRPTPITALLVFALFAAACGDDDADTTTTAPAQNDTTVATSPPPTAATATSATPDDSGPDVGDLLARYEITPLRTTYLLGESDNQTEIILAQDPTADPPVESITIVEADSKIIISGGVTIFCEETSCFEIPGGSGAGLTSSLLGPISSLILNTGPDGPLAGAEVTEEPITVAGRDGICFTYMPTAEFGSDTDLLRQCIDNEFGFTLLMQSSDATTETVETVMELIDFSQPTPEDFEPTGPVTPTP